MKKYQVSVTIDLEANSPEEAGELFVKGLLTGQFQNDEVIVHEVLSSIDDDTDN